MEYKDRETPHWLQGRLHMVTEECKCDNTAMEMISAIGQDGEIRSGLGRGCHGERGGHVKCCPCYIQDGSMRSRK